MAHSSSGDSCNSAPEFLDAFTPDERVQKLQFFCPLCLKNGTFFYCERCIRNGSFTHSVDKRLERFADKKLKLYKLIERKERLLKRYQDLLSEKTKVENVKLDVASRLQTNKHLKAYIKQVKEKVKCTVRMSESIRRKNEYFNNEKSKLTEKICLMKRKVNDSQSKLKGDQLELRKTEDLMKVVRQKSIQQLVIHIFPIVKVKAPQNSSREYLDPDEHMEAVYVTGQWELACVTNDCDFQYKIIESCIPANGNYSAYLDWSSKSREEMPTTEEDDSLRDAAYNILTALSFTAHLLTVLCFYLDAHVPKRLTPNEFNCNELREEQFLHKVAKLNIDVVYLCLLQNVDPAHIRPHHTIENLLLLLDLSVSDLGRCGPMEVTQRLPSNVEDYLASELLANADEDDSSGNFDDISGDWVKITASDSDDEDNMVVCEFGTMTDQSKHSTQRASLTGELISSVANFWKAATWQKS